MIIKSLGKQPPILPHYPHYLLLCHLIFIKIFPSKAHISIHPRSVLYPSGVLASLWQCENGMLVSGEYSELSETRPHTSHSLPLHSAV